MTIILIHGFYRDKTDMSYLEQKLTSLGYKTHAVNLPTTFGSFKEIVDSLSLQLKDFENTDEEINIIAHSMGGLIAREYINAHKKLEINNCIFIATPHHGTKLADIAKNIPLFSSVFKPINFLSTKLQYAPLENKSFKLGLIAGDYNNDLLGRTFMSKKSDGRVDVASVKTDDADDFIVLPFNHDEIHKKEPTLNQILHFLENGVFKHKEKDK